MIFEFRGDGAEDVYQSTKGNEGAQQERKSTSYRPDKPANKHEKLSKKHQNA